MKKEIVQSLVANFDSRANKTENNIEFWIARDLQHLLGYTKWDNFLNVINKGKTACEASGHAIETILPTSGKWLISGQAPSVKLMI